jgi:hypothetical protein
MQVTNISLGPVFVSEFSFALSETKDIPAARFLELETQFVYLMNQGVLDIAFYGDAGSAGTSGSSGSSGV